jgi:hypothetical protein
VEQAGKMGDHGAVRRNDRQTVAVAASLWDALRGIAKIHQGASHSEATTVTGQIQKPAGITAFLGITTMPSRIK